MFGEAQMNSNEALAFCNRWLPCWTGNRPDVLVDCYAPEVFYRDPANPGGIRGKEALRAYLVRLLAVYPDWVWECEEVFPVDGGFVLKWRATIPVAGEIVQETGMDLVLIDNGLVVRNEVYFDRTALLAAEGRRHGQRGGPRRSA